MSDPVQEKSPLEQIVDHVVSGAEQRIPGLVAGWLDRAASAGQAKVANLPPSVQPIAQRGLDLLVANRDALAGVSQRAVVAIMSRLALGQGEEAKRVYLATNASFDEQSAVLDDDASATQQDVQDRSAAWDKVKTVSENLLVELGEKAIPLVLAI